MKVRSVKQNSIWLLAVLYMLTLCMVSCSENCYDKNGKVVSCDTVPPPPDSSYCKDTYPDSTRMTIGPKYPDATALSQFSAEYDLAFRFDNWCTWPISAADLQTCRCKMIIDSLGIEDISVLQQFTLVKATLRDYKRSVVVDATVSFDFANWDVQNPPLMSIYEHSILALDFEEAITDPTIFDGIFLQCGGLCVVENIDGGDKE